MRTFQNHIELHWDCTTKAWENTRNNMPERPDLDPREQIRLLMNGPAQEAPVMQPIPMFAVAELHEPEPDHGDDMVPFLEESDNSDTEDDFDDDQIDAMLDVTRLQHQNREEWQQVFYKTLRVWQVIFGVSQNAIRILLSILYTFLQLAGQDLIKKPPNSGDAINRVVPVDADLVEMKTACLKCKTLYAEEETYDDNIGPDGKRTRTPKLCSYQEIPHGFGDESNECGNKLAKQKTNEHTKSLDKVPYARIAVQLRKMFQRPGFKEACQKWRTRANWLPKDVMADVYDGDVWQQDEWVEFWDESEYNVGLQLNLDWLEPHKSAQYSLGAIYLVILNLPRDIRYKRENIILVATLPDSSEHVGTTSRLVLPMVQQLIRLWDGEEEVIPGSGGEKMRAALLQITADLPAGRVVSGLLSCSAQAGCSRCKKKFKKQDGAASKFGNFIGDETRNTGNEYWTDATRRAAAQEWKDLGTQKARDKLAQETGCRWSSILLLEYYDSVRFLAIDAMHNLYMGTAKNILKVWGRKGVVDLVELQTRLRTLRIPRGIGRVLSSFENKNKKNNKPKKLKRLTAEELMTFVMLYSDQLLFGTVDSANYKMWKHFSAACRGSSGRLLYKVDVPKLQERYYKFLVAFEELHPEDCKPNMHLGHESFLSLMDYGPNHASWCFAFERMNGILGRVHMNNKAIQLTVHHSFVSAQQCDITTLSRMFPHLDHVWRAIGRNTENEDSQEWTSIMEAATYTETMQDYFKAVSDSREGLAPLIFWGWKPACLTLTHIGPKQRLKQAVHCLKSAEYKCLIEAIWESYDWRYNRHPITRQPFTAAEGHIKRREGSIAVSQLPQDRSARLRIFNTILGSVGKYVASSYILAKQISSDNKETISAGQVQGYYEVIVSHRPVDEDGNTINCEDAKESPNNICLMAYVKWYQPYLTRGNKRVVTYESGRPAAQTKKKKGGVAITEKSPTSKCSLDLKNLMVYSRNFLPDSKDSWLPVMQIWQQFIPWRTKDYFRSGTNNTKGSHKVLIACPVPLKYAL